MSGSDLRRQARAEVERCVVGLILDEPYFGHLLAGLARDYTDKTPTAAVALTKNGLQLWVNPTFFIETITEQRMRTAIIKHEALHLVFKHLTRMKSDGQDHRLFNVAADLVVNQFVEPWPLPDSAILLDTFPDLNLLPDQSVEWYYERLSNLMSEMAQSIESANGSSENDTSAPKSAAALRRILGSNWHSDHGAWAMGPSRPGDETGVGSEVPDGLRDAFESALEEHLLRTKARAGGQAWGRVPGAIRELIETYLEGRKPKVDWRRALRIFSHSSRRTRVVTTSRKMSKRYGTFPGIKLKRLQRVAVAIDTSGSISEDILSDFFAEVHGIWRQGGDVDILECDAAVNRVYPYRGRLPSSLTGGGGTAFDPVFEWLRSKRHLQYDACIYLTDGYGPAPEVRPRCRTMWVITPTGTDEKFPFGRQVKMQPRPDPT